MRGLMVESLVILDRKLSIDSLSLIQIDSCFYCAQGLVASVST